jgi:cell division protein FtsI (penicillin-binding protein 3)
MVSDQQRYDEFVKFGLGSKTAIDFPARRPAVIIHPVKDWDPQSHYTTTFGQYYTVTAPQDGQRLSDHRQRRREGAALAGRVLHLGRRQGDDAPAAKPQRVLSESVDAELSRMLENVAVTPVAADQDPGYRVAIKTARRRSRTRRRARTRRGSTSPA